MNELDTFEKLALIMTIGPTGSVQYTNSEGKLHRENGPAQITDLHSFWLRNGILHRTDGPAVEWFDGKFEEYYIDGVKLTREEFDERTRYI